MAVRGASSTDRSGAAGRRAVNSAETDVEKQSELRAFRARLEELGWSEGRNIRFDYRWTDGRFDRLSPYAAELVDLSPDVIWPPTLRRWSHCRKRPAVFRLCSCRLSILSQNNP